MQFTYPATVRWLRVLKEQAERTEKQVTAVQDLLLNADVFPLGIHILNEVESAASLAALSLRQLATDMDVIENQAAAARAEQAQVPAS